MVFKNYGFLGGKAVILIKKNYNSKTLSIQDPFCCDVFLNILTGWEWNLWMPSKDSQVCNSNTFIYLKLFLSLNIEDYTKLSIDLLVDAGENIIEIKIHRNRWWYLYEKQVNSRQKALDK